MNLAQLRHHPNALASHYSAFGVADRLLLTGHSHQAWPDCARQGLSRAWDDAAELADRKWTRAMERADRVRQGFSRLLDEDDAQLALAGSTHELVVRFLSALPLRRRPRLVSTDGEFHSLRRQLGRLAEEGVELRRVASDPADRVCALLERELDQRTAAVLVSSVMFRSGQLVRGLDQLARACQRAGALLLVDAYHSLNVAPFSVPGMGLSSAYVVGGGYKYCQLGEGNCFLRLPPGCQLRPVVTGWFAEFHQLDRQAPAGAPTHYDEGAARFAGSTYDPTSHYRAAEVFDFFEQQGLTPALLRQHSQHQLGLLARRFDALDLPPGLVDRRRDVPLEQVGGFLALRSPRAAELRQALHRRGVFCDHRSQVLRLGPAPYLSDRQLRDAVGLLGEATRELL